MAKRDSAKSTASGKTKSKSDKSKSNKRKKAGGSATGHSSRIDQLRRQLDKLDRQILAAINERADLARLLTEFKESGRKSVFDPKCEQAEIDRAISGNQGPLHDVAVRAIFRELVSGSRAVLSPLRVAYLGPEFTYSHVAALERFGESVEFVPVATIGSVFEEIERKRSNFGVVPLENSTDGRVSDTLECFAMSSVRICGEIPLRIHHCLLGCGKQSDLEIVHSKPQALSQCRNWLAKHLPEAGVRPVGSTAEAATLARANPKMGAVASAQAAQNYGLRVLAQNIEDNTTNTTRFAVIGPTPADRTGTDKTSLMFEIAHEPGALADAMAIFKRNRLNMTWIESFPISSSRGRYLFFVEFVGHQRDLRCRRAIAAMQKKSLRLEVLGSYAQVEPIG